MSAFGKDLIHSFNEALAHVRDEGLAVVHKPVTPREVRKQAKLTQAQIAPFMGMSPSGCGKWEQGVRQVSRSDVRQITLGRTTLPIAKTEAVNLSSRAMPACFQPIPIKSETR